MYVVRIDFTVLPQMRSVASGKTTASGRLQTFVAVCLVGLDATSKLHRERGKVEGNSAINTPRPA